ncbi:MAG: 2,3-bisphosphoglycerate-independent phosphoglycerate mutase [Rhodothermales bacterium]|nr:2,3-bisphosphoglycerate-independent phosphoglycerate mutase [Rhodothermales bacterium]
MAITKKHILIILDGYGIAEDPSVSAIDAAHTPFMDRILDQYPHSTLVASGLAVGLPEGQMGNSEVGHTNLGAGRVVYQDITRIDKSIADRSFFKNEELLACIHYVRKKQSKLHLIGLFSDGGVHSTNSHVVALLELAAQEGLGADQVCVHAFTDGRDTPPDGGAGYARAFEQEITRVGTGRIASVVGRYLAMDRDNRWGRTEQAYRLLVEGTGGRSQSAEAALLQSYRDGVTDEFVHPVAIGSESEIAASRIGSDDAVIFFNFRADRARQLTRAFTERSFDGFERGEFLDPYFVTFTPYDADFNLPIAFPKVNLAMTIGEVVERQGGRQLRAAETEKYPHVTYFFSGGREDPFDGEDRILVASPKVATYDLQPEMSAPELAERVAAAIRANDYNLVILNFANPDMVGHTGVFKAAVAAVEATDKAASIVFQAAREKGYSVEIIADHGNADKMINPDGTPHTAHTTALVHHIIVADGFDGPVRPGKLGDIAPTMLNLLEIDIPPEMDGDVLI